MKSGAASPNSIPASFKGEVDTDCAKCKTFQTVSFTMMVDPSNGSGKGSYKCSKCKSLNNIQVDSATVRQIYDDSQRKAKRIPTWKLVLTCGAAAGVGLCAGLCDVS